MSVATVPKVADDRKAVVVVARRTAGRRLVSARSDVAAVPRIKAVIPVADVRHGRLARHPAATKLVVVTVVGLRADR